jgi:hypothetical protein
MFQVRSSLAAFTMAVAAAAFAIGCGCGVAPVSGPNSGNGAVTFDSVPVGSSQQLAIPFQDTAYTDETITGATVEGPDADEFEVVSRFPMAVPAGQSASVEIRFAPTREGSSTATLILQTAGMGPSPVELDGTAVASGR